MWRIVGGDGMFFHVGVKAEPRLEGEKNTVIPGAAACGEGSIAGALDGLNGIVQPLIDTHHGVGALCGVRNFLRPIEQVGIFLRHLLAVRRALSHIQSERVTDGVLHASGGSQMDGEDDLVLVFRHPPADQMDGH